MKFLLKVILIAAITFGLQFIAPWWCIAIAPFLINIIIKTKGFSAFFSGFFGIFCLWLLQAFLTNAMSEGLLIQGMSEILPTQGNVMILMAFTATIGGLVGALSAYAGNALRNILFATQSNKKKKGYYNPYS